MIAADQISHMLLSPRSRVILDWTPRAACTTVLCIFLKHVGLLEEALSKFAWPHNYRPEYYERHGIVGIPALRDKAYTKIKFVRNPYRRAVSCYEHLPPTYSFSFKGYLRILLDRKETLTSHELYHSIPQARESDVFMDHVVKIEHLQERLLELNKLLRTDFEPVDHLPVIAWHRQARVPWPTFAGEVGRNVLPTVNEGDFPRYADYYDDESRMLVDRVFDQDVKAYDYSYDV